MDFPVLSWVDDITPIERKDYTNLKCLLPSGRIVPGQVPIVKEFGINWGHDWRSSIWEDGRHSFRLKTIVEREGLHQAFDIDRTPGSFIQSTSEICAVPKHDRSPIRWVDGSGAREAAKVDITL